MFRTMRVLMLAGSVAAVAGAGVAAPKSPSAITSQPLAAGAAAPKPDCANGRYTGDSHICTAGRQGSSSQGQGGAQGGRRYTGDSAICTAGRTASSSKPASGQPGSEGERRYTGDSSICTAGRSSSPSH
jgi:hypothetical protein